MKNDVKTTTVTVQVVLEISGLSSWGPDCSIAQVHRQATEEAIGRVMRLVGEDHLARIIGALKVSTIILTKDDR